MGDLAYRMDFYNLCTKIEGHNMHMPGSRLGEYCTRWTFYFLSSQEYTETKEVNHTGNLRIVIYFKIQVELFIGHILLHCIL